MLPRGNERRPGRPQACEDCCVPVHQSPRLRNGSIHPSGCFEGFPAIAPSAMRLQEHDEAHYRTLCLDLGYEMGMDIYREGGDAMIDLGIPGAGKTYVARPVNERHFWEETWVAMRVAFPKATSSGRESSGPAR